MAALRAGARARRAARAAAAPTSASWSPTSSRSATTVPASYVRVRRRDDRRRRRSRCSRSSSRSSTRSTSSTSSQAFGAVPTAIICGTKDMLTSIGHSRKMAEQHPTGSQLVEVDAAAGHMVDHGARRTRSTTRSTSSFDDRPSGGTRARAGLMTERRSRGRPRAGRRGARRHPRRLRRPRRCSTRRRPPPTRPSESVAAALAEHGGLLADVRARPGRRAALRAVRRRCSACAGSRCTPTPSARGVARALVRDRRAGRAPSAGCDGVRLAARAELPAHGPVLAAARLPRGRPRRHHAHAGQGAARSSCEATSADEARARSAQRLAGVLRAGDLVILSGDLGAGKTTFTQGVGDGLQVRGDITSPTFVISRVHPSLVGGPALVHVDAYRLGGLAELDDLDLDISLDDAVTVVEWGEGVAEGLADDRLEVAHHPDPRRRRPARRRTDRRPAHRPVHAGRRPLDRLRRRASAARVASSLVLLAFDTATAAVTVALHDGERVVAVRRPGSTRCGTASCSRPMITAVLDEAGRRPPGRHRGRRRRRPRPVHRAAGRPGHRAHPRRSRSASRSTASARLDVLAAAAVDAGASPAPFLVATDARRKEVYWASYDDGRAARLDGPARVDSRPTSRPTARWSGAGALLYPDAFPRRRRRPSTRRRRRSPRVVAERARRAARPRAALPAPPRRGRSRGTPEDGSRERPRDATVAATSPAVAALEAGAVRRRRLVRGVWSQELDRRGAGTPSSRSTGDAVSSATPCAGAPATSSTCSGSPSPRTGAGSGLARALLDRPCAARAADAGADRMLLEVSADNDGRARVLRRRRVRRDRPAPRATTATAPTRW